LCKVAAVAAAVEHPVQTMAQLEQVELQEFHYLHK
jgi:hypothetical protein